jgi:hypothetical protein
MRRQVVSGICPINAKREERANQVTFKEAANAWIATHKSAWKGGDTGSQMRNTTLLIHTHASAIAGKPVKDITPDMVQAALNKLWARRMIRALIAMTGRCNTRIGVDSEVYMAREAIWAKAGMEPFGGAFCVGCLEKRLGRRLKPKDFQPDHPFNRMPGTPRLLDRRARK